MGPGRLLNNCQGPRVPRQRPSAKRHRTAAPSGAHWGGGHVKRASPGTGALCAPPRAAARGLLLVVILQQFALDGPQEARRDLVVVAVPRVLGLDDGDAAVLAGEADEVLRGGQGWGGGGGAWRRPDGPHMSGH